MNLINFNLFFTSMVFTFVQINPVIAASLTWKNYNEYEKSGLMDEIQLVVQYKNEQLNKQSKEKLWKQIGQVFPLPYRITPNFPSITPSSDMQFTETFENIRSIPNRRQEQQYERILEQPERQILEQVPPLPLTPNFPSITPSSDMQFTETFENIRSIPNRRQEQQYERILEQSGLEFLQPTQEKEKLWQQIEQARQQIEQALQPEQARHYTEQAWQQVEQAWQQVKQARHSTEQVRQQIEQALRQVEQVQQQVKQLRQAEDLCLQNQTSQNQDCIRAEQAGTQNVAVLVSAAVIYSQSGNTSQSIETYQKAIDINDQPTVIESPEELLERQDIYTDLILDLWKEGRFEEAFVKAEEARTLAFRDQLRLADTVIKIHDGTEDSSLSNQVQEIDKKIALFRRDIERLNKIPDDKWNRPENKKVLDEQYNEKKQELERLKKDYEDLVNKLKLKNPEIGGLIAGNVQSLNAVQNLLDNKTALVEYYVTDEVTLCWIITKHDLSPVELKIGKTEIANKIDTLLSDTKNKKWNNGISSQLSSQLFSPLLPYIKTKNIGIVPHDVIANIPFSALTNDDKYLNEDYNIFILPSSNTLGFLKEKRKQKKDNILVFGNPNVDGKPDLPYAQNEAQTIAKLFGTNAFIGRAAKESVVWSQSKSQENLHFAAHGEYKPNSPLFSLIYLAKDDKADGNKEDGHLEAREVFSLDMTSTNLVVLSACETQRSRVVPGSELTGLSGAFILAGSPSIVASLWKVDDEATEFLMTSFYKHLKEGKSRVEALRMAQIETRQQYESPYYWAGFVLTGDPGN